MPSGKPFSLGPCYYESIETVAAAINQQGVHFKIIPKVYNFKRLADEGFMPPAAIGIIHRQLLDLAAMNGLDTDELLPENIGVYIDAQYNMHPLYQDPGNMLHRHDSAQMGENAQMNRLLSTIRITPETIVNQANDDQIIRKEVNADAKQLFDGKLTEYAKRLARLERDPRDDDKIVESWVKQVKRALDEADRPHLRDTDHPTDGRMV